MALNRLIDDESNRSAGEETEALHILRKWKNLEEERERLLSIASENKDLWSLLMNNKILLDGYTSANTLPSQEAVSMESNQSNVPITEVKRKRKKGAVRNILDTIEGEQDDDVKTKVLKQVLQHKSIRHVVQRAGFVDSESREYVTMSKMLTNAKKFIARASETQKSHGRSNDDKRSAVETLQVAMVQTPDGDPNTPSPSRGRPKANTSSRAKARLLNIPFTTFCRNEKKAAKKVLS